MTRNAFRAVLLGAALLVPAVAPPAAAQGTPPRAAAPADPATRAEAVRLIEAMNMGSIMEQTIMALRPALVQQFQAAGRATPQQAETAVTDLIVPALRAATPEMLSGIADIWARHFTPAEMRELRAFYDTPIGRKSLALTPQMTAETQTMVQGLLPRLLNDVIGKNRDALRQRGIQL